MAEINSIKLSNQSKSNSVSVIDMLRNSVKQNVRQYTMVIALVAIWIIFTALTEGIFISSRNLSNLFLQACTTAILASGMVLIMVAGHIDLSVGRLAGFCGAVAAVLQVNLNMGTLPAIVLTIGVGLVIGLWQGYWVAFRGVPAFIVTLSSMLMLQGAILGVTGGNSVGPMKDAFKAIGQGYVPKLFIKEALFNDTSAIIGIIFIVLFVIFELRKRKSREHYGFSVLPMPLQIMKMLGISVIIGLVVSIMVTYMGIPYSILVLIAIVALLTFATDKTALGRHIYALGGNKEAARLSGINIKKVNMVIFVIMGVLSAIAGIVYTGRINTATTAAGQNMELDAIASAVIGGTSTMGGEGTIIGAIIGALVMASLDNGMSLLNVPIMWQYLVKGMILLLAVWVDIATRKKAA